jgi:hypothetical protein
MFITSTAVVDGWFNNQYAPERGNTCSAAMPRTWLEIHPLRDQREGGLIYVVQPTYKNLAISVYLEFVAAVPASGLRGNRDGDDLNNNPMLLCKMHFGGPRIFLKFCNILSLYHPVSYRILFRPGSAHTFNRTKNWSSLVIRDLETAYSIFTPPSRHVAPVIFVVWE